MSYYINKIVKCNFEDALKITIKALQGEGFAVLTEINIHEKLKEKLNVDYKKYKILGACNPTYAHKALQYEDKIGTMLPCNIIIQEINPNETEVAAIDPIASMRIVNNENLSRVAIEVREKLNRVINSVEIKDRSEFYI